MLIGVRTLLEYTLKCAIIIFLKELPPKKGALSPEMYHIRILYEPTSSARAEFKSHNRS